MTRRILLAWGSPLLLAAAGGALLAGHLSASTTRTRAHAKTAEVLLAGGCYWGVESVFEHVRGVKSATSGFAIPTPTGGGAAEPHAEAVRIVYDPSQISYRQILDIFFSVVHDPTQPNRQGPDVGTEYRSIVFVDGDGERTVVQSYIDSLAAAHVYPRKIVTEIASLQSFQVVPESQQNYAEKHPTDRYIVVNDVPKVAALKRSFPSMYRE